MIRTFVVVVLMCAGSVPREGCNKNTAKMHLTGSPTHAVAGCGVVPQMAIARDWRPAPGDYVKITCEMWVQRIAYQGN